MAYAASGALLSSRWTLAKQMFSYPRDLAQEVLGRLEASRERHLNALQVSPEEKKTFAESHNRAEPFPTKDQLADLLDAAFFASLAVEEGAAVRFSLLYSNPLLAEESNWPALRLARALPLEIEAIRKLSPAARPDEVDIGVYPDNGRLHIWGLVYLRSESRGARSLPPGLTVTSLQPGSFTIRLTDRELATFTRGHVTYFDEDAGLDADGLRTVVSRAFSGRLTGLAGYKLAAVLLRMCGVALDNAHGATILLIPEGHATVGLQEPRYAVTQSSRRNLSDALADPNQSHVANALAHLSAIDGALVFDEGLGFRGAGAMIQDRQDHDDFPVKIINPSDTANSPVATTLLEFHGGARHRSALVFCYANPGALAMVISQDGIMSVLVRPTEENCVYAIRPIRRGMKLG